jgi:hypothetical protein
MVQPLSVVFQKRRDEEPRASLEKQSCAGTNVPAEEISKNIGFAGTKSEPAL